MVPNPEPNALRTPLYIKIGEDKYAQCFAYQAPPIEDDGSRYNVVLVPRGSNLVFKADSYGEFVQRSDVIGPDWFSNLGVEVLTKPQAITYADAAPAEYAASDEGPKQVLKKRILAELQDANESNGNGHQDHDQSTSQAKPMELDAGYGIEGDGFNEAELEGTPVSVLKPKSDSIKEVEARIIEEEIGDQKEQTKGEDINSMTKRFKSAKSQGRNSSRLKSMAQNNAAIFIANFIAPELAASAEDFEFLKKFLGKRVSIFYRSLGKSYTAMAFKIDNEGLNVIFDERGETAVISKESIGGNKEHQITLPTAQEDEHVADPRVGKRIYIEIGIKKKSAACVVFRHKLQIPEESFQKNENSNILDDAGGTVGNDGLGDVEMTDINDKVNENRNDDRGKVDATDEIPNQKLYKVLYIDDMRIEKYVDLDHEYWEEI